ncbi:DEAD/DEAH box helicase [Arthrobacter sp. G119Y2]|uniref:DEAD/DEAH box helicase n=1 Tax=Arthrobacter sp. G119Y2 TaxID=3134965 RepID=UPI00311A60F2
MFEVVYGESRNRYAARALAKRLDDVLDEGTVYLGYPVLATADEKVQLDALLVSRAHGVVAFILSDTQPFTSDEWSDLVAEQDRLYAVLESHLSRHDSLRSGRRLATSPNTATIFPNAPHNDTNETPDEGFFGALDEAITWLEGLTPVSEPIERALHAALQRVTTIKPAKKRASVVKPTSRGAVMKQIEKGIANLDRWQKAAAIESPEGPQRIRGLAGSGKTVVLALKAAYWHSQHPEWNIALTFHSRALYQQIDDLVTRFAFEHMNDKPDPDRLRIVHSWGSSGKSGIYSLIARSLGEVTRDWSYAMATYGRDNAFQGVCRELLLVAQNRNIDPIFDAVLIDEAQDLPPEFFQLVYLFTKEPKRIVWGYDELQKLSDAAMPSTDELFGKGPSGESLISLASGEGEARRDIVLPICYRNTPWALATAHALGFGVYRSGGLLQHFDEPTLWKDIGYNVLRGSLEEGTTVTLERSAESYPSYFPTLVRPDDAVILKPFVTEAEQDSWVADEIVKNLADDELEHDDILVVLPDPYRAKSRAPRLMRELHARGIPSHLVGVNTSVDEVFQNGSIALAHIHRAKGNEAPMVYAIDSQFASSDFNSVTRRNSLFTAITRSRAWVRITGFGDKMSTITSEATEVVNNGYQLKFPIPTKAELAELRHVHRDRPEREEAAIKKATDSLMTFLEAIERGELDIQDLPPAVRTRLTRRLRRGVSDDDA